MTEFEVTSPVVFDVPPQNSTNIQVDTSNLIYTRPDKQKFFQFYLTQGDPVARLITKKNIFITKIMRSDQCQAAVGARTFRIFDYSTITGSANHNYILKFIGQTAGQARREWESDFNPPLFIDMQDGKNVLQVDILGLADVSEIVQGGIFYYEQAD